jgi:excisionase family DNA binding protein
MKHEKPRDDDATPRRIMTATEVAAYFKVHPTTIYKLLRHGKLPAFKIGTDWRFDRGAIEKLVTDRTGEVVNKEWRGGSR